MGNPSFFYKIGQLEGLFSEAKAKLVDDMRLAGLEIPIDAQPSDLTSLPPMPDSFPPDAQWLSPDAAAFYAVMTEHFTPARRLSELCGIPMSATMAAKLADMAERGIIESSGVGYRRIVVDKPALATKAG